jgi:sugar phosphate isomerase/epimerase
MYKVKWIKDVYNQDVADFDTIDEAMEYAKKLGLTVEISTPTYQIVGKFGADEIKNGITPDGLEYGWTKRRIGQIN